MARVGGTVCAVESPGGGGTGSAGRWPGGGGIGSAVGIGLVGSGSPAMSCGSGCSDRPEPAGAG